MAIWNEALQSGKPPSRRKLTKKGEALPLKLAQRYGGLLLLARQNEALPPSPVFIITGPGRLERSASPRERFLPFGIFRTKRFIPNGHRSAPSKRPPSAGGVRWPRAKRFNFGKSRAGYRLPVGKRFALGKLEKSSGTGGSAFFRFNRASRSASAGGCRKPHWVENNLPGRSASPRGSFSPFRDFRTKRFGGGDGLN